VEYVIHAMGLPFNGDTIKTRSLGGSESAAYYLARELARRGHRVTMFTNDQAGGIFEGVNYQWCGQASEQMQLGHAFEFYARNTPHDVLIVQRHPLAFHKPFASKINIWQTHDLALHRTVAPVAAMTWNINAITTVSEWHKEQTCGVYPLDRSAVHVVPNGVDPELYSVELDPTFNPVSPVAGSLRLLYQSRPERGLEHLVRPGGIMDRLRGIAHLYVCGYENTTQEMAGYYAQLGEWSAALPNVTNLGALTKADLAQVQRQCDTLIYPTEFGEVSCITAMEAMHARLPMVTSECAALPETCRESGTELIPLKGGLADEDAFVAWVKIVHEDHSKPTDPLRLTILDQMRHAQEQAAKTRTWAAATDALESVVADCFKQRSDTAMLHHLIKSSDYEMYRELLSTTKESNAITERLEKEVRLFDFLESDAKYQAHYDHFGDRYYREHAGAFESEVVGGSRWQATAILVGKAREQAGRPLRILDYGCAHGHYTLALAKMFPDCALHGVDINAMAIREAVSIAGKHAISNAEFTRADNIQQGTESQQPYDVVILAEILEHVRDPYSLLEAARARLGEGGVIVTTTPYGPWEWIGHEEYKGGRSHVRHFERADLVDIFTGMELEILCAPAGNAPGGAPIGSWCAAVRPAGKPFGRIDVARKLRDTMPGQTISACLIVKDGERSLRKTLDSLVPWVAEVVVGIDPATTDDTHDVIAKFARDNPWLPVRQFINVHALSVGFGEARNRVIEKACGDWILWMDSDEEIVGGSEIPKLMRPNMHAAYCTPQIHYSIQPPQVLTTDYPSRLYRNRMGIKFFGLVHEHPEVKAGEAIPTATMRGDVQFAHNGYQTEEVRRNRYFRNLPLLMRDVNDNPDRILNKFLLIRDLAQGIGFELQMSGGQVLPEHRERAARAIALWRELLANEKPVARMLLDALQYYTLAAEVLGGWFNVDTTIHVQKLTLDTNTKVQGKFLTANDFTTLINRLSKEATAAYDSAYF